MMDERVQEMEPWVEKYRPQTLDELVTRPEVVETRGPLFSFFPHLLLFGPPGTGKTSAILAVARTLYGTYQKKMVLELNASDDRGIQVVRETIKECANSSALIPLGPEMPFKLIVLDECDNMTKDAQMSLRRVMEASTKHVRFCLMCNHPNQLLPAIRSRCAQLRFPPLDQDLVKTRIRQVLINERMIVTSEALDALVTLAAGDLRYSLNTLQILSATGEEIGVKELYEALGYPSPDDIRDIQYHLLNSTCAAAYSSISKLCRRKGYALIDVLREVAENLLKEAALPQDIMIDLVTKMGDYEARLSGAANEQIQLLGWIGTFLEARESLIKQAK